MADFSFLTKDIARQRELAQQALEEAKRIDSLLQNPNVQNRQELEQAKQKWLDLAKSLAENITVTSNAASTSISTLK